MSPSKLDTVNTLLNVHQSLTLTYIQAQNELFLKEQLKISQQQQKEQEEKKRQNFLKALAFFNMQFVQKIEDIYDKNMQYYFLEAYLQKLLSTTRFATENLNEISDKEYCQKIKSKIELLQKEFSKNINTYQESEFYKYINNWETLFLDYVNMKENPPALLQIKKLPSKTNYLTWIVISGIISLFSFSGFIQEFSSSNKKSDGSLGGIFVMSFILFIVLIFISYKDNKKSKIESVLIAEDNKKIADQNIYNHQKYEENLSNHEIHAYTQVVKDKYIDFFLLFEDFKNMYDEFQQKMHK